MVDADAPRRRLPLIATGLAAVAVTIALVALAIVMTREAPLPAVAPGLETHRVLAADVVSLTPLTVELIEDGKLRGGRVKDAALARKLALAPGDLVTAIAGRPLTKAFDLRQIIFNLTLLRPSTIDVDVVRGGGAVVVRWEIEGDLRRERYAREVRGTP